MPFDVLTEKDSLHSHLSITCHLSIGLESSNAIYAGRTKQQSSLFSLISLKLFKTSIT